MHCHTLYFTGPPNSPPIECIKTFIYGEDKQLTRKACSERDQYHCGYSVSQAHGAAQVRRQIVDQRYQNSNKYDA